MIIKEGKIKKIDKNKKLDNQMSFSPQITEILQKAICEIYQTFSQNICNMWVNKSCKTLLVKVNTHTS